jgi:hypothetical protein
MITRVSLVQLRADLPREACLRLWAGEHADLVRGLEGILEYSIDVAHEPRPHGWDAVALIRFEDEAAFRRFEDDPSLQQRLRATRDAFAEEADAFLVDEYTFVPPPAVS